MKPIDVALTRLAARQYSLAHRQQALDLGMTPRQIHPRLASGWLTRVHQAVCRVGDTAPSLHRAVLAACLATGPEAVASHTTAAALCFPLLTRTPDRLGGPGRSGAGVLRELVEERDPATAPTESVLEDALLRVLRRGGLPEPVRQYEVGGVRLDAAYPEIRLGIEADSRVWHGGRLDVQRNSDKANALVARGWRILHFTWRDLRHRPSYVVDAVGRQLVLACPA